MFKPFQKLKDMKTAEPKPWMKKAEGVAKAAEGFQSATSGAQEQHSRAVSSMGQQQLPVEDLRSYLSNMNINNGMMLSRPRDRIIR